MFRKVKHFLFATLVMNRTGQGSAKSADQGLLYQQRECAGRARGERRIRRTGIGDMKARPIIFNGEMVRALLDGRKTQTRRVIKPQPQLIMDAEYEGYSMVPSIDGVNELHSKQCPFGTPGDLLWVRESIRLTSVMENGEPISDQPVWYLADNEQSRYHHYYPYSRPAIHMPRWASRITLKITSVHAERMQDISFDDAVAEGINWLINEHPVETFSKLWDSIYADKGYGWDKNPWVWVIKFDVIKKNVDEVLKECFQHV